MILRILMSMAGHKFNYSPGDFANFPEDEALRLIERGYAEAAGEDMETAEAKPIAKQSRTVGPTG